MTKAIDLLNKNKIEYSILEYKHNPNVIKYGKEAVQSLNLTEDVVFKTLILYSDEMKTHITIVIPIEKTLSLKKIAKFLNIKKYI